jgi:hydrogenase maturation protease
MPRAAVIALGSVLMSDDGLGSVVLGLLASRYDFPDEVELLDLGTPGPDLGDYMRDLDGVIVVDTVQARGRPGELKTYRRDEILAPGVPLRMSPHDPGLAEAILTLDLEGSGPREALLVGVIPALVELGTELSPPVAEAIPGIEREVLRELERLGLPATEKAVPDRPDLWWRRGS